MSDIKAIEEAVRSLEPKQLAKFRQWFSEFDFAVWDAKIESDALNGKLHHLLAEASEDFKASPAGEL